MGCKMDEDEEALCIIRDFSGLSHETKVVLHVPPTMTVREFIKEVAKRFNYESDSLQLVTPSKNFVLQALTYGDDLMKEKVSFLTGSRNLFVVEGLNNCPPKLMSKEDDLEIGASASPDQSPAFRMGNFAPALPGIPAALPAPDYSSWKNSSPHITPETSNRILGFRGLVNQAMTCYLNSLIQALYMTPEFRNGVYNWKFSRNAGINEAKSIPFQLQKLFLNLQTSNQVAVHTTELTRSFGWDSSEAWQQHDIQELCRVMFDALEHEFKGTEQSDLIEKLYGGKLIDYVKCLECGVENKREDKYLDIPLPIRPFGSVVAFGSIEEALRGFVKPETLEGNNQYFCDKCNKKCDAHKGLKFSKFPYLLTLHLMRFDFDYNNQNRIKLNDTVTFPEVLNLNSFIPSSNTSPGEDESEGFPEEIAGSSGKCDDGSTTDSNSAIDDEFGVTGTTNDLNGEYEQEDDEGIDVTTNQENEKNRKYKMAKGPYIYELFAVMVHSGSANGGHYYVLIKDLHSANWYSFNDQTVTPISREDISKLYGSGPRNYYSSSYGSNSNAYMLMYRQIDKERNRLPMTEDEFPDHIKELLQNLEDKSEIDVRMQERNKETCKIKVYVQHPTLKYNIDVKIECAYNTPLKEVTQLAYNKFLLEDVVPLEQCRLVLYNSSSGTIEGSLEDRDEESVGNIILRFTCGRKCEMWMDIRQPHMNFIVCKPSCIMINVYNIDLYTEAVEGPTTVCSNVLSSIGDLKIQLHGHFNQTPDQHLHLYVATLGGNTFKFLENYALSLKKVGLNAYTKLYICFESVSDETSIPRSHKAIRNIVDKYENTIRLNIILPSETDFETYKKNQHNSSSKYSTKLKYAEDQNLTSSNSDKTDANRANVGSVPMLLNAHDVAINDAHSQLSNSGLMSTTTTTTTTSTNHSDQSTSEDSSLTDSDRTIIGDVQPGDCPLLSDKSSPTGSEYNASPTENLFYDNDLMSKLLDVQNYQPGEQSNKKYTFKEIGITSCLNKSRNLMIEVDRRMAVDLFKKQLEVHIGITSDNFRLYDGTQVRYEQNSLCSFEIASLKELKNEDNLYVKLSRSSDLHGKVYYLDLNEAEIAVELFEWIIDQRSTVAETKKELLEELAIVRGITIPFNRCRLRKKWGKAPGQIYDNRKVWKDLNLCNNWEMYVQQLQTDDRDEEWLDNVDGGYCVLLRKYNPTPSSGVVLEPFQEIVIQRNSVTQLRLKISEVTGIPMKHLVVGKESLSRDDINWGKGVQVDWLGFTSAAEFVTWPFIDNEDDFLIYYKDNGAETEEISSTVIIQTRRRTHLRFRNQSDYSIETGGTSSSGGGSNGPTSTLPVRRERCLKIHIDKSRDLKE